MNGRTDALLRDAKISPVSHTLAVCFGMNERFMANMEDPRTRSTVLIPTASDIPARDSQDRRT